jgi:hypothetical protein
MAEQNIEAKQDAAKQSTAKSQAKLNLQMREVIGSAYAFVRGRQYTETMANITYEELLDAAIDSIEGVKGRSDVRGTKLDRIEKIKAEISQAVDTVKSLPPSQWQLQNEESPSEEDAMNTEE